MNINAIALAVAMFFIGGVFGFMAAAICAAAARADRDSLQHVQHDDIWSIG